MLFKIGRKIGYIVESGHRGNFADGEIGIFKKPYGVHQSQMEHIPMQRHSRHLLYKIAHIIFVISECPCYAFV